MLPGIPELAVRAIPVWSAVVDIGERESLGVSALGERWIVPITGGHFEGAPGYEALRGKVRAGGADRQLQRNDGTRELSALYEMQADDGAVLTILNAVVVDDSHQPRRYALSHLRVTAPEGPHAWMNRRTFVGTLQSLRPQRQAVLVRGFLVVDEEVAR